MTGLHSAESAIGPYARETIRLLLRKCAKAAKAAAKSAGPDEVHDVRTSLRRLLACTALFEQFTNPDETERLRRRAKKLMKAAGAVRDSDIALALLRKSGVQAVSAIRGLQRERKQQAAKLEAKARKWNACEYTARWADTLFSGADPAAVGRFDAASQARDAARVRLPELIKDFFVRGDRLFDGSKPPNDPARLHGYRLRAKEARYALEAFADCYGGKAPGMDDLRTLQDLLGSLNDNRQLRKRLFEGDVPAKDWQTSLSAFLSRRYSSDMKALKAHWISRFSTERRAAWMRELTGK